MKGNTDLNLFFDRTVFLLGSGSDKMISDLCHREILLQSRGQNVKGFSCQTESFALHTKGIENWGVIRKKIMFISCVP